MPSLAMHVFTDISEIFQLYYKISLLCQRLMSVKAENLVEILLGVFFIKAISTSQTAAFPTIS